MKDAIVKKLLTYNELCMYKTHKVLPIAYYSKTSQLFGCSVA